MQEYSIEVEVYTSNQKVESKCNAITFINPSGSGVTFTVNNIPILEGNSLELAGKANEIDITQYLLNFGTVNGTCYVIKKVYL